VIVFKIFRRNGDCTFFVTVKIGGDSKIMLGLGAISFDKAFNVLFIYSNCDVNIAIWLSLQF
jgi:hypothetical protein